jgi:osmoprotectant transport system ATP-binding protein
VVLMRSGQVAQDGTPRQLFEQPADEFVRRFVAAQRMTLEGFATR